MAMGSADLMGATSFRLATERAAHRLIRRIGLLEGLDDASAIEAAHLLAGKTFDFSAGEQIFAAGEDLASMWLLLSGTVTARDESGRIVGRWLAPCVFGESGVLEANGRQSVSVWADQQAAAIEISSEAIAKLEAKGFGLVFWRSMTKALAERAIRPMAPAVEMPAVEHREVCVMFTDVVAFSKIAATRSPAETALILARIMARQSEAIENRGGHVDKLMGDGLMAYWEISPSMSRAQACKLALTAAIETLAVVNLIADPTSPDGDGIKLRIGMHVGDAAHGDFGSGRVGGKTLIGSAVNVACRMEQARLTEGAFGRLAMVRASEDFYRELDEGDRKILSLESHVTIKGKTFKVKSGPEWLNDARLAA